MSKIAVVAAVGFAVSCTAPAPQLHSMAGVAQGTTYSIQWWSSDKTDPGSFPAAIEAELGRLDELLSNYRNDSAIERFNQSRTLEPQQLPREIVELLRTAADVHRASAGCFDPTVKPLVDLWGLDRDTPQVPAPAAITATLERVGFDKVELLSDGRVRKTVPDLALDFASIGQGYTIARLAETATEHGIHDYLIELGGEIAAIGAKPDGEPWRVGIEEPRVAGETGAGGIRRRLTLPTDEPVGVVTSGTYRRFFEVDGRQYSHILDPRTGRPVDHTLVSATVIDRDPALAAAWATALLCLGPDAGQAAAERQQLAALLYVRDGSTVQERTTMALERGWSGRLD